MRAPPSISGTTLREHFESPDEPEKRTGRGRDCGVHILRSRILFSEASGPSFRATNLRSSPQNRVTKITDLGVHYSYSLSNLGGRMDRSTLGHSISKLAIAGEQAGFTVEQMIQLLNDGLEVSSLISLIHWKLDYTEQTTPAPSPYRWVC